jgi:hypothetical protein
MRPVPVVDTADRVRTLSLPGYTEAWGYDPTGRCYLAELWLDGTPTDRRPTFRLTADTPAQLGDLIAEFTYHSRPAVRAAMTTHTPTARR